MVEPAQFGDAVVEDCGREEEQLSLFCFPSLPGFEFLGRKGSRCGNRSRSGRRGSLRRGDQLKGDCMTADDDLAALDDLKGSFRRLGGRLTCLLLREDRQRRQ